MLLTFAAGRLRAQAVESDDHGRFVLRFEGRGPLTAQLRRYGKVPLPPYIRRESRDSDRRRYQTVYARRPGAVAAPTAGLHLTRALLGRARRRGLRIARLTLAVGPGTFRPIQSQRVEQHRLESEPIHVPSATLRALRRTRACGGRVVAVGTTVVRALESLTSDELSAAAGVARDTELLITPGFEFRLTDVLLTNFHLPRSSLLALVMAFGGVERVRAAYADAIRSGYRFYSYGDAMLVERISASIPPDTAPSAAGGRRTPRPAGAISSSERYRTGAARGPQPSAGARNRLAAGRDAGSER
jgi:S-adenosylmethionine:tRNA ribosyltransferase-isomerase